MKTSGYDISLLANGRRIFFDDCGSGGIPILFIHGFPFDKSMWQPQVDFFSDNRRVIAYDIRGFGKSASDDEEVSMGKFAADMISLLDLLEIPKVIACGMSMGGYVLLDAVSKHPERFKAIVLSDTQCIADSDEAKEKRYTAIEAIKAGGLKAFAEGFIKNIFWTGTLEHKKELVEKIRRLILTTHPDTITSTLKALADRNERCSILTTIAIPVLILCGEEDRVTPLAQAEFMHKLIPGSELASIENAGHMSNLEQPDLFNSYLAKFISALPK